jgi:hypothetical protein
VTTSWLLPCQRLSAAGVSRLDSTIRRTSASSD